jgi:hypothetical protein
MKNGEMKRKSAAKRLSLRAVEKARNKLAKPAPVDERAMEYAMREIMEIPAAELGRLSSAEMEALTSLIAFNAAMKARHPDLWDDPRSRGSLLLMIAKMSGRTWGKNDSLIRAKLAAKCFMDTGNLDGCFWLVDMAVAKNDKQFFIHFGKCLSGSIKDPALFDKRDRDIAEIVAANPRVSAGDACLDLARRGHHHVTKANFRVRKMRLLKAKRTLDAIISQSRA